MSAAHTCVHCGGPLDEGSLFCGTCGRSTTAPPRRAPADGAPALVEPPAAPRVMPPVGDPDVPGASPAPTPEPRTSVPRASQPRGIPSWGGSGTVPGGVPESTQPGSRGEPLLPVPPLPDAPGETPASASVDPEAPRGRADDDLVDLERTVLSGPSAPSFVLQFSTGESVTVRGEGLIGRAPVREPGEAVDQLIALADAGRSVSKTHVGFGQDRGRFWVSDRFSTNGTVVRPPDEPARRCEPGRRYLVSRGTRVDIGDQFFVVS